MAGFQDGQAVRNQAPVQQQHAVGTQSQSGIVTAGGKWDTQANSYTVIVLHTLPLKSLTCVEKYASSMQYSHDMPTMNISR